MGKLLVKTLAELARQNRRSNHATILLKTTKFHLGQELCSLNLDVGRAKKNEVA